MDDMERLGQVTADLSAENAEALKGHQAPMPPLGQPPITSTTVKDNERFQRLLRITCAEHGILTETTWNDEELKADNDPMQAYLQHVVGAHREPYGASCGSEVNVALYDGDRAPVTLVWGVPEYAEFPRTLLAVFATPIDAEKWIADQRNPRYVSYDQEDHNVLHYLPTPAPTEEPEAP